MAAALNDIYNRSTHLIQNFTHNDPLNPVAAAQEVDALAGELAPYLANQGHLSVAERRFVRLTAQEIEQARAWIAANAAADPAPAPAAAPGEPRPQRRGLVSAVIDRIFRAVSWVFRVFQTCVRSMCGRTAARIHLPARPAAPAAPRPPAAAPAAPAHAAAPPAAAPHAPAAAPLFPAAPAAPLPAGAPAAPAHAPAPPAAAPHAPAAAPVFPAAPAPAPAAPAHAPAPPAAAPHAPAAALIFPAAPAHAPAPPAAAPHAPAAALVFPAAPPAAAPAVPLPAAPAAAPAAPPAPPPLPVIDVAARIAALPGLAINRKVAAGEYLGTFNQHGTPENEPGVDRGAGATSYCALNLLRRLWEAALANKALGADAETQAFIDAAVQEGVRLRRANAEPIGDEIDVGDAWDESFANLNFFGEYEGMEHQIAQAGGDEGRGSYRAELQRLQNAALHVRNPSRMLGAILKKGDVSMPILVDYRQNNPRYYVCDTAPAGAASVRVYDNPHHFVGHLVRTAPFDGAGHADVNKLEIFPFTVEV